MWDGEHYDWDAEHYAGGVAKNGEDTVRYSRFLSDIDRGFMEWEKGTDVYPKFFDKGTSVEDMKAQASEMGVSFKTKQTQKNHKERFERSLGRSMKNLDHAQAGLDYHTQPEVLRARADEYKLYALELEEKAYVAEHSTNGSWTGVEDIEIWGEIDKANEGLGMEM